MFYTHIENLARAIFICKKSAPGIAGILSRIQKGGIKGVHIEEYESYDPNGPYVKGDVKSSWLFDNEGFNKIDYLPVVNPYDGISSPFPKVKFSVISEQKVVINCIFGPRAARGFLCKPVEVFNFKTFEYIEGSKSWIA